MSESVPVRRMTATVTVTRDITVVLPIGITDKEALGILGRCDLNGFTDGHPATIRIDEVVRTTPVDPAHEDTIVMDRFGAMRQSVYSAWTTPEEIEKYAVKTKEPHPEG